MLLALSSCAVTADSVRSSSQPGNSTSNSALSSTCESSILLIFLHFSTLVLSNSCRRFLTSVFACSLFIDDYHSSFTNFIHHCYSLCCWCLVLRILYTTCSILFLLLLHPFCFAFVPACVSSCFCYHVFFFVLQRCFTRRSCDPHGTHKEGRRDASYPRKGEHAHSLHSRVQRYKPMRMALRHAHTTSARDHPICRRTRFHRSPGSIKSDRHLKITVVHWRSHFGSLPPIFHLACSFPSPLARCFLVTISWKTQTLLLDPLLLFSSFQALSARYYHVVWLSLFWQVPSPLAGRFSSFVVPLSVASSVVLRHCLFSGFVGPCLFLLLQPLGSQPFFLLARVVGPLP